jgi:serine protease AprX
MDCVRRSSNVRRKAVWGPKRTLAALLLLFTWGWAPDASAGGQDARERVRARSRHFRQAATARHGQPNRRVRDYKVDERLTRRIRNQRRGETVDIIACLQPDRDLPLRYRRFARHAKFSLIPCYALDSFPVADLEGLGALSELHRAHENRRSFGQDLLSSTAVQADVLANQYGYTGQGVTVAFLDSGFTRYSHPDLEDSRVAYLDFVNRIPRLRADENGHGTHVAGIVAGNGRLDTKRAGIAPGVSVLSMKVLDEEGKGSIGDIIAAMDWIGKHHKRYNIRVVNMSVGAGVYESYWTDPLTLAAKALVDRGITVVAAAGNFGKNAAGELQWGGITAPGVAPWVLTVCAFSTGGTVETADDSIASFSSSGPTAFDFAAKPDICAPGVGIVSLAAPESALYSAGALASPSWLTSGLSSLFAHKPYMALTGTSQATPFVTGTVALMLQANPNLTPNLIKAILQYTATKRADVSPLRQGGGFMNTLGAVSLAKFYAQAQPGQVISGEGWSQEIIWGNYRFSGGVLDPRANAWMAGVQWGWAKTQGGLGDNIVWGTQCGGGCDNIVWGTIGGDNIVWGTNADDNIVWGTNADDNVVWGTFGGDNIVWGTGGWADNIVWGTTGLDNIVWGTTGLDNIVWGTGGLDNIVWGTGDLDNIVWGTTGLDNIVWGTGGLDNIVWGTDCGGADCDNVVWGTTDSDNIVWGTAGLGDNIVWGTGGLDNIVWGTGGLDNIVWGTSDRESHVWPASVNEGR